MKEERVYYVYRHLRNDNGMPFYIGRGKYKDGYTTCNMQYSRAYDKNKRTDLWKNIYTKHGCQVEIILDDLTYKESIDKEIEFIELYGRQQDGGILCNFTEGGQGLPYFKHSETTIEVLKNRAVPLDVIMNSKIERTPDGCWLWRGTVVHNRPMLHFMGKQYSTKRFLYSHINGVKLTRRNNIHGTCGNKICVNPDHHQIHWAAKGVRDKGIFTENMVRDVKQKLHDGHTHQEIADIYNVSRLHITKIANGHIWSWVSPELGVLTSDYFSKNKKPVMCIETGEVFPSAKEAAVTIFGDNTNHKYIRKVCSSGKYTYCKGYNFKFV